MHDASVVIVGGGVAGTSLLYHLTRLGWSDALLLEKDELTSGSTWHAAGLCTQFNASAKLMNLLRQSLELYASLEAETGQAVDLHRCGSIRLADTSERLDEYRERQGMAEALGIPFELISPERVCELFPLLVPEGLLGAAYLPTDGYVDPTSLTQALAKGAQARGARILRHTRVMGIARERDAWRLATSRGEIRAGLVVNAAGMWAGEIGRMVGVELPLVPLEHHYLITEPVAQVRALDTELPVLRDVDASYYVREEGGGLLVGPFEVKTQPFGMDGIPVDFAGRLLPADLERLEDVLAAAAKRIPVFAGAGIRSVVNGPDAYTPDGRCLMGPVPGVRDFHVLAGFSIFGIVFSGGAGRYAAEWIVQGQPSDDLWELDVRRFDARECAPAYVAARACDVYAREYAIHYPEAEHSVGRPLRTSPLYDLLRTRGAVYGTGSGWERPLWFAKRGPARDEDSFRRSNWHGPVGEECRAVRSRVGVLDATSLAKFEVVGPGAARLLDRLCANRLPVRVGQVVRSPLCTPRGGILCDVTVTRLDDDRFYLVAAAAAARHHSAWIEDHLPDDGSVRLENRTDRTGVLMLAGPRARELLQALSSNDCSHEALPCFHCRELLVGSVPVRALRVASTGEQSYELHHPIEFQHALYEQVMEAGRRFDCIDFGYRALASMRLERGGCDWGAGLSPDRTPLESGLEHCVALDKGDFIGRDALLRQRARGAECALACLVVDAADADAHGGEPILAGDSVIASVATGGYGHRVERSIALAYLPARCAQPGTALAIRILGGLRAARVAQTPLYDPKSERSRA